MVRLHNVTGHPQPCPCDLCNLLSSPNHPPLPRQADDARPGAPEVRRDLQRLMPTSGAPVPDDEHPILKLARAD